MDKDKKNNIFRIMVSGPNGEISSKRIYAMFLLIAGITHAFLSLALKRPDAATTGVLIGGCTGILVGMAMSHT